MNQNRLSAGLITFVAVLLILVISGSVILIREWKSGQAQVGHRSPLPGLGYCSSKQITPCILSFNLDSHGNMVINMLTDGRSAPNFYLKIQQDGGENIYKCQKVKGFSTSVACVGESMPVGEVFQFLMISTRDDTLLAQGSFPIIGLALATPEIFLTPTPLPPHYR